MNYTQGKWQVTKWASHNDIHVSVDEGSYMRFIANCGNPKADSLPTNPNAEANAHLIASAPAMYEALKAVKSTAICNGDMTITYAIDGIISEQINEALKQVEGK